VPRYLLVLLLFTLKIFACYGEFSTCYDKAVDSKTFTSSDTLSVIVDKNSRIFYSAKHPSFKVKKYDYFLGLYLIDDKSGFAYPFIFYTHRDKKLASISKRGYKVGYPSRQCGLDHLGKFSKTLSTPSIITDNCCALAGILTKNGLIDKVYLKRFLNFKGKEVTYGDAGIRIEKHKNSLHVRSIDPFFKDQKFKIGDEILAFDGKKVRSVCSLRQWILFAKIGSVHTFKIRRHKKILYIKVKIAKRLGGGLLSDTFLERLGLNLDSNLCISSITSKTTDMQLDVGDCLIQINFEDVKSQKDIQMRIKSGDVDNALLFERKKFQFFIHINGKNGRITKKND
jgi:hypothetical protein